MVMEIINKVLTILMQLMWKVVRPEDLKLGDHVYRYGLYGLYSHHGIYVGNGYVIHFIPTRSKNTIFSSLSTTSYKEDTTSPCPVCGHHKGIHRGVIKTCLDCFRQYGRKHRSLHRYEYGSSTHYCLVSQGEELAPHYSIRNRPIKSSMRPATFTLTRLSVTTASSTTTASILPHFAGPAVAEVNRQHL